ncbi:DUF4118 domain-containing protein [Sorangium sp. So ce887]|uniref:DUF4118 domain-containing protein n=1 Tax=Sorangium sp. So ce887 TaxID=3133324 RepID=UPI003F648820
MWSTEEPSRRAAEGSAEAPLPAVPDRAFSADPSNARPFRGKLWNLTFGPFLVLSIIGLIEFIYAALGWNVPNPPAILSMIVVFVAFSTGLWGGIITALISCVYFALYFSDHGIPFHYTENNLLRVIVFAVTTPTVAIMTSIAKHRASRGAQARLVMDREGLLLCFSTRLSALDKLLVEGMIVGVLGRETDCYVAEYRVQGDTAIVRLCGSCRADLERVAEALYLRVWEQVHIHQMALVRIAEALQPSTLKAGLGDLFGQRLARMELREPAPTVADSGPSARALVGAWTPQAQRPAPPRFAGPGIDQGFLVRTASSQRLARVGSSSAMRPTTSSMRERCAHT